MPPKNKILALYQASQCRKAEREAKASSPSSNAAVTSNDETGKQTAAIAPVAQHAPENETTTTVTGDVKYEDISDDIYGVSDDEAAPKAPSINKGKQAVTHDAPIKSPPFEPWTGVEDDENAAPSMSQPQSTQPAARNVVTVRDIVADPNLTGAPTKSAGGPPSGRVSRAEVEAVAQSVQDGVAMDIDSSPLSSAVGSTDKTIHKSNEGSDYEDSDEEGQGDGLNVVHLHKDDIRNIKYNDVFDLIHLYVPRGGSVEHYTVCTETRRVRDAMTHKYIGDLDTMFPVANEELTKALEFRNDSDPVGTISYRFPKNRNTPGTEGRINLLWPKEHDVRAVKGKVNLSLLLVVFRDIDKNNKVGIKFYPGLQDGFDFDNGDHIDALNKWRNQIKTRKLGTKRFQNQLNYEWTQAEHKYLIHVMAHIFAVAKLLKEKNVEDRLDYRAIEEKMDRHFNGLIQRKDAPLAHEACDMPATVAEGQKTKDVRRKLRSDRKALIHTVEEIKKRVEACMAQIKAHKTENKYLVGGENWIKFLVPIEKKVPKPVDNTCVCGRDWTDTDMDREKTQRIKDATDRALSGNKLKKADPKGKGRANTKEKVAETKSDTDYEGDDFAAADSDDDPSPRPTKRQRTTVRQQSQLPELSQAGPGPQTQASRARASLAARTTIRTPSHSASPSASTRATRSGNKSTSRRR